LSNPYPLLEYDPFSYEFVTDQEVVYKIYFLDYAYLFNTVLPPDIPVYALNVEAISGKPNSVSTDERIGLTIAYLLDMFFQKIDNVLVYVCDGGDGREIGRKRKFDIWFARYNKGNYHKEEGLIISGGMVIFNALIIHNNHPKKREIIEAYKLINTRAEEK